MSVTDWMVVTVCSCNSSISRLPCALQEVIKKLPDHLKIVDLSADFRLRDPKVYAEWCVRGVTLVWRMRGTFQRCSKIEGCALG